MRIYLKNYPAEFHADPIWNGRRFKYMKIIKNNEVSGDIGSVPTSWSKKHYRINVM